MRRSFVWPFAAIVGAVVLAAPLLADSGPNHQVKQTPPIQLGTSGGSANDISHAFCCGGTLGSAVLYGGQLHILSNNHILARSGSAVAGEDTLQPGLIDSSCSATGNIVGDFIGNVVPLGTNVDAALSLARSGMVDASGAIIDLPAPPCSVPAQATVNMPILKSGRTTGCANGTVQAVNVNLSIRYQKGCGSGRKFTISYTNQVSTTNISAGGDSGSLILSQTGLQPVALLYAGSSSVTIGNPIQEVISTFQATGKTFSFVGTDMCTTSFACPTGPHPGPAGAVANSVAAAGIGPSAADIDFVRQLKERHEPGLFSRPGVLGVGVGAADDDPTEAVIVVYVEASPNAHPRGLPSEIEGVKVRVIPTDPFVAL